MRALCWNINGVARDIAQVFNKPTIVNTSRQAITIAIEGVNIFFVHASYIQVTRHSLWHQLNDPEDIIPWLVMEDFNYVLRNDEKKGRLLVINEFSDWMDDKNLFEADSLGSFFTWANSQSGARRIINKLDRSIINEAWLNKFENWRCKSLPRKVSDHFSLIGYPFVNLRPKRAPFRIQKMWFTHPKFFKIISDSWNVPAVGNPVFIFPYKLQRLKQVLKDWNHNVFGNVNIRLKQSQLRLESAIRTSDEDPTDVTKFNLVKDILSETQDIQNQQNIMLRQKAMNKWLLEGASNSGFLHSSIRIQRSNNTISELVDESGVTISDCDQICNHDCQRMDSVPSEEEIHKAVFELGADNAPRPDGFSGCFYRHCWEIIHRDLFAAIIFCWKNKFIPNGANSSLIILLDKVRGVNSLHTFIPIGLSNLFFKIFTKILATRLGIVLDNLVSKEQVAFMKGKNIHENISVASEMVNEIHIRRKDGNLRMKLDIS
ncbi:uncharacterized protein LOC113272810 [Papaver somniferum]|uniref:uncharacterized protein LOC113272810 n=1 Tax=Papaver somniferum TaxID=3469 RepID=UPI000E700DDF|nr:uncharacterized protein LOC113272810 [Papaver somniferum]